LLTVAVAYVWAELATPKSWSWMQQIGSTSLIVYWVHIEIVYGRWFGSWKQNLTSGQCVLFAVVLTIAMLGLSIASTRWKGFQIRSLFPALAVPEPRRASGD
jgi:fucose 4-O-acetylase-like acetyltransferase